MTSIQSLYRTVGHLREATPFNHVFPDRMVPITSIIPMRPRDDEAPLCYEVNGALLTDEQVSQLAELMYERWQDECDSLEAMAEYIRQGLPLSTDWFQGASSNDTKLLSLLVPDDESDWDEDEWEGEDE